MTNAYVYKWTHLPTLRWYVGSRFAKGCHTNDGYICSSDYVKNMIELSPEEWKREIIRTGSPEDMYQLETDILEIFDARNDYRSFNCHNNDFGLPVSGEKHYMKRQEWREIQSERTSGEKNPMFGIKQEGSKNGMYGVERSAQWKASISGENNPMFGKFGGESPASKRCHTTLGWFDSIIEAAQAHNLHECTIRRRIKNDSEKFKEYFK